MKWTPPGTFPAGQMGGGGKDDHYYGVDFLTVVVAELDGTQIMSQKCGIPAN